MAEFPIVGIGSSAGGLEALQKLFRAMPPESGLGFIVAAHLDPTQKSHLTELLSRCTKMPVVQIDKAIEVEPNHVYVIAPDQELTMRDGVVHTNRPTAPRGHRHPVDSFFRSLAEDQGARAIAIVLSGTGTNGSLGLRFIKAEGGIVLAQEPETAAFTGMPRSAIGTGVVDLVLAPEKMPEALLGLAGHLYVREPAKVVEGEPQEQLGTLLSIVRAQSRLDFTSYKKSTVLRRIHRRMGLHRIDKLGTYIERLRNDLDEIKALADDLMINVTGFFRDPEAWQILSDRVIAPLVRERPANSMIRVWAPACSTGEEVYSIAMLILEHAEAAKKSFDVKLFATDVAEGVLGPARAGMYPASIAQDVTPERLERWFTMEDDTYRIKKTLREMITFAPQNLLQDPPFSRLDLISCRNLLIYIEPEMQKRLLGLFHFALRQGGYLFLGSAESITGQENLFESVSKKWRIYRRLGPTRHDIVDFPLVGPDEASAGAEAGPGPVRPQDRPDAGELMDRELLEHYAPASALVDRHFRVQYLRGPIGEYLQPPRGEPSYNLVAMARQGLQTALRSTLRKAIDEGQEVRADGRVRRGGGLYPVRVVVNPLRLDRDAEARLLVSFFERDSKSEASAPAPVEEVAAESELQAELEAAREDLRLTIEQMEASNEELKASNEEIRSINEELQASNEELETTKEELQSLNEELHTVNNQLQAKVGELEARTDDLHNLLNSSDVLTLFLDRNLCIRWFTPSMKALLELRSTDIGRPISHFAQRFSGGDLLEDTRNVLERLQPFDAEVVDDLGRWYIRHIIPYRTGHDRIEGVVVTFTEITERKHWEQEVQRAREFAESIVRTVREPLLVLTPELEVRSANESFYRAFHVTREQTENRLVYELGNRQWDIPKLRRLLEEVLPTDKQFEDYEVEHEFEGVGRRTMLLNARQLDSLQLILLAIEDVTERKRAEAAVRASENRLRKVLETDAVGVLFFDQTGTLIEANEVFLRLTGYARSEVEARALTWRTMTPPEWIEISEEQMKQLEATGRLGPYEKQYFLKDGSRAWMLFAGASLDDGTIVEYCLDINDRKRAEAERELLAHELSHRVKNTLAVVQALAMQTNGRIRSVEAFRETFIGRLQALARAHGILFDTSWRSADLKTLVEQTLAAYRIDHPEVVEIEGEPVALTPQQGLGLSLMLHELGTNAVKYGALSQHEGRLRVSWRVEERSARCLRLKWEERHGPPVEPPTDKGFGLQLIERAVSYELEGAVELDFPRDGFVCELVFPLG
jgi:PAS domain S-box-containing protein